MGIGKQVPYPYSPFPTPFLRGFSFKLKLYMRAANWNERGPPVPNTPPAV